MPVMRCKLPGGKMGYKWGKNGKCYARKSSALKQNAAIRIREGKQ